MGVWSWLFIWGDLSLESLIGVFQSVAGWKKGGKKRAWYIDGTGKTCKYQTRNNDSQ